MSDNYLYYFSAVEQVNGAIISIGGIFLVLYIQSVNKKIIQNAKGLIKSYEDLLSDKINSMGS